MADLLVAVIFVVAIALAVVVIALVVLRVRRARAEASHGSGQRTPARTRTRSRTIDRVAQKEERGKDAEARVAAVLDDLPAGYYRAYHELYPKQDRSTRLTEVDHVVVSPFGIFVVETKGIYGEVFVDPDADEWRIVRPQREDPLRSPLKQNEMHLRAVASTLGYRGRTWVRSIVCFGDDASRLRGISQSNVLTHHQLRDYIVGFQTPVLDAAGVHRAIEILDALDVRTAELAPVHDRQIEEDRRRFGS